MTFSISPNYTWITQSITEERFVHYFLLITHCIFILSSLEFRFPLFQEGVHPFLLVFSAETQGEGLGFNLEARLEIRLDAFVDGGFAHAQCYGGS